MAVIDLTMETIHTPFAGIWAGWALFVAVLVIPAARSGRLGADALDWFTGQYTRFSSVAAVVMLLTGGHLAGTYYTTETLTGSSGGHLVLTMVALWLVLTGLSHVSRSRLKRNLDVGAKSAAAPSAALFYATGVVALALLVVAGWL